MTDQCICQQMNDRVKYVVFATSANGNTTSFAGDALRADDWAFALTNAKLPNIRLKSEHTHRCGFECIRNYLFYSVSVFWFSLNSPAAAAQFINFN